MYLTKNTKHHEIRDLGKLSGISAGLLGFALLLAVQFGTRQIAGFEWALAASQEDAVIENLQALCYLGGIAICIHSLVHGRHRFLSFVWLILCFMFLGEEISWGQRIFDFSVASVEAKNVQGEFNLHNLAMFQGGGLTRAQTLEDAMKAVFDIQFLFQFGFISYFYGVPLVSLWQPIRKLAQKVGYVWPGKRFLVTTLGLIVLSYIIVYQTPDEAMKDRVIEVRELVFSGAILFYLAVSLLPIFKKRLHWYLT